MFKIHKILVYALFLTVFLSITLHPQIEKVYAGNLEVSVQTNKAVYNPGEGVTISVMVTTIVGGDMVLGVDGATVYINIETPEGSVSGEFAVPGAIIGSYSVTYPLSPAASGGVYKVYAEATHPGDNPGSDQTTFSVAGAPGKKTVDWRVENPWISPANPTTEDSAIINVWLRFATVQPGPFPVDIICTVDGTPVGGGTVTPTSPEMTVFTPVKKYGVGTHTVTWVVDPNHEYNDPNNGNNQITLQFTVASPTLDFDFSLSASPASHTIPAGDTSSYALTATLTSGDTKPVTLHIEGLPSEATHTFSSPSGNPTFTSTLTIQTSGSTPPGTYSLTLIGEGGELTKTITLTLIIEKPPEIDFTFAVSPLERDLPQGESTFFTLTTNRIGSFDQPVTFTASGLPSSATSRFNPVSGVPPFTSTLTIETAVSISPGEYKILIEASGAGKTHSSTITLFIIEKPSEAVPSTSTSTQPEETSVLSNFLSNSTYIALLSIIVILAIALIIIASRRRRV